MLSISWYLVMWMITALIISREKLEGLGLAIGFVIFQLVLALMLYPCYQKVMGWASSPWRK